MIIILSAFQTITQAIHPLEAHLAEIHNGISHLNTKLQSVQPTQAHLSSLHNSLTEMKGYSIVSAQSLQKILTALEQSDDRMQMMQYSISNLGAQVANLDIAAQKNTESLHLLSTQVTQLASNQSGMAEMVTNNAEVLGGVNAGINEGILTQATAIYGTITVVAIVIAIFIFLLFSSYRIAARDIVRQVSHTIQTIFTPSPRPQAPFIITSSPETSSTLPPSYSSIDISTV